METLRAFLSGCMAFLSFSSPKGSAEALPEVFSPLQNLPAPSHTANTCRIRRLPTLPERLCEIAGITWEDYPLAERNVVELIFRRAAKLLKCRRLAAAQCNGMMKSLYKPLSVRL